jgi:hypothetical protein
MLLHTLAVFGVFIAVAYPIWWVFAPSKTTCLICRSQRNGDRCGFCHRITDKSVDVSPRNLRSAIFNGLLILLFSFISMAVVYGEQRLLYKLGFPATQKTATFAIPTKGQYKLGQTFPMQIEITGITLPINVVQADIGFDPAKVEAVDVSTEGSFANIFIQKEINNSAGYVRLTGGLPNPGYSQERGVFGTVLFRGKESGPVRVKYLTTSMVLANDGRGTNILKDYAAASFLITGEKVTQEEKNQQVSMGIETDVLGQSSNAAQLKFYNDKDVLSTATANLGDQPKPTGLHTDAVRTFFEIVSSIDDFVITLWTRFAL